MTAEFDHQMMGIALTLARQGLGRTAPNPSVGAVLADEATGEVIARGTTAPGGRPHAERVALAKAGERAGGCSCVVSAASATVAASLGATLYVTLEPCSHHGQTSPCADAVIEAGIARVVCAITDPDPRVAGRGLARLRAAGLTVERGLRAAEAAYLTRGHILRVSERRPFVQLKLALGADGSVPQGHGGRPTFVSSVETRALGHLMRARADAILVGAGTVAADDPDLTCRLPGLSNRSPVRVVLARSLNTLAMTRLAATARQVPVWAYGQLPLEPALEAGGIVARAAQTVGDRTWLPAVLENLAAEGITRLLVEGGPAVWRSFAQAGLADEVVMFVASPAASDALAMSFAHRHLGSLPLVIADRRRVGPDTVVRFTVTSSFT